MGNHPNTRPRHLRRTKEWAITQTTSEKAGKKYRWRNRFKIIPSDSNGNCRLHWNLFIFIDKLPKPFCGPYHVLTFNMKAYSKSVPDLLSQLWDLIFSNNYNTRTFSHINQNVYDQVQSGNFYAKIGTYWLNFRPQYISHIPTKLKLIYNFLKIIKGFDAHQSFPSHVQQNL